jgi:hypothetical protein
MQAIEILRRKIAELELAQRSTLPRDHDRPASMSETLELVETEVGCLLRAMATCQSAADAGPYFDKLGQIQELLATLRYKYRATLTFTLDRVVEELDRVDDEELRSTVWNRIHSGEPL